VSGNCFRSDYNRLPKVSSSSIAGESGTSGPSRLGRGEPLLDPSRFNRPKAPNLWPFLARFRFELTKLPSQERVSSRPDAPVFAPPAVTSFAPFFWKVKREAAPRAAATFPGFVFAKSASASAHTQHKPTPKTVVTVMIAVSLLSQQPASCRFAGLLFKGASGAGKDDGGCESSGLRTGAAGGGARSGAGSPGGGTLGAGEDGKGGLGGGGGGGDGGGGGGGGARGGEDGEGGSGPGLGGNGGNGGGAMSVPPPQAQQISCGSCPCHTNRVHRSSEDCSKKEQLCWPSTAQPPFTYSNHVVPLFGML